MRQERGESAQRAEKAALNIKSDEQQQACYLSLLQLIIHHLCVG